MTGFTPPRYGDPDGSITEQTRYWIGFGFWILLILVALLVAAILETAEWIRKRIPG